ncbi:phage tail protein [Erwinia persicina]|uniref:Phage tail protein n=1 Tax=Erwinia persicina TaxID=55211 RepID=A0A4U3FPP4_9GAMM|nr:phage tail protein [Erwinia persicina]
MGGKTIAEARENLSFREYQIWAKYRAAYGNLNPMMRTEWAAALVASTLANVNRGKNDPPYKITDFAPHMQKEAISLKEAMDSWA